MSYSYGKDLNIIINSGRDDFLLKDFVLFFPNVNSPAVGKAKAADSNGEKKSIGLIEGK